MPCSRPHRDPLPLPTTVALCRAHVSRQPSPARNSTHVKYRNKKLQMYGNLSLPCYALHRRIPPSLCHPLPMEISGIVDPRAQHPLLYVLYIAVSTVAHSSIAVFSSAAASVSSCRSSGRFVLPDSSLVAMQPAEPSCDGGHLRGQRFPRRTRSSQVVFLSRWRRTSSVMRR